MSLLYVVRVVLYGSVTNVRFLNSVIFLCLVCLKLCPSFWHEPVSTQFIFRPNILNPFWQALTLGMLSPCHFSWTNLLRGKRNQIFTAYWWRLYILAETCSWICILDSLYFWLYLKRIHNASRIATNVLLYYIFRAILKVNMGTLLVAQLLYKPEGPGFDSRFFRWNFSLT